MAEKTVAAIGMRNVRLENKPRRSPHDAGSSARFKGTPFVSPYRFVILNAKGILEKRNIVGMFINIYVKRYLVS